MQTIPGNVSKTPRSQREALTAYLGRHGIARLAEIRRAGVTAATVSRPEREGIVIRLGRGLYQLASAGPPLPKFRIGR